MAAFAHLQQLILAMETYEHIIYFFGVEVKNSSADCPSRLPFHYRCVIL